MTVRVQQERAETVEVFRPAQVARKHISEEKSDMEGLA